MLVQVRKVYFYFILINITISANAWQIFGLSIGQLLYWQLLFLGVLTFKNSSHFIIGYILLFSTIFLKVLKLTVGFPVIELMSDFASGLFFILVGAILYGENPSILYKQLLFFFTLSLPFMLFQKIGVSTFFYGWSTELFHDNGTYTFDEVKDLGVIFKNIPLYPTLFVNLEDVLYVMYQGRPTGLLYSNNVLSVLLSLFLALHYSISNTLSRKLGGLIVITATIALVMSTLVYGVVILLFVYFYFVNKEKFLKSNALKTLFFTFLMLFVHYLLFPGLTITSFGVKNAVSFISRFDEIFQVFGLDYFQEYKVLYNLGLDQDESYSLIGSIVKNDDLFVYLFFFLLLLFYYYRKLLGMKGQVLVYVTVFVISILTQFGVNFLKAPSFQVFLGIACYPLIKSNVSKSLKQIITP